MASSLTLLTGKSAQANCFRCHAQEGGNLAGAAHFEKGRELYLEGMLYVAPSGVSMQQAPNLTNAGVNMDTIIYMNRYGILKPMMKIQNAEV